MRTSWQKPRLGRYPKLRNAGPERLWFVFFKGLLTANTHPHEEMAAALRNIASRRAS
jgi:hypothetical protein